MQNRLYLRNGNMKTIILAILICFSWATSNGQNYDVRLIPDSLTKHANAVMRFQEQRITIKSISKATVTNKWAVTILNEAGERHSEYANSYDKFNLNPVISGRLYDAYGREVRSLKNKDVIDQSNADNSSLINDARIKHYSFYYKVYPYTVEYEEEQEMNGIYHLPTWQPIGAEFISIQESNLIIETPLDYNLRYKIFNLKEPEKKTGKDIIYTWKVNNLPAIQFEEYQPSLVEIVPTVLLAPTKFSIDGYEGNMSSWLELGKFQALLNKERDILPDNLKLEIHRLSDTISNTEQKVKVLYNYMQQNTHYINIILGIGGWQPLEAKYVAEKKYGDCKALSNYMVSILKEAGVKAHYVKVLAGEGKKGLWEDFPCVHSNHIITCIPNGTDTLWLECTSQTESPGFMGSFTGNRKALLVAEDGGHVVNTPSYKAADNLQVRKVAAIVDEEGNLKADVFTKYTGIQQETPHSLIYDVNKETREKYLNNIFNLPTYSVDKSEYTDLKGRIPLVNEYLKISAPSYASITEKRLFIKPYLLNETLPKLITDKPRKFPIVLSVSKRDIDTISITLPYAYVAESIPKDLTINNKFGRYSLSYKLNGNLIEAIRFYESEAASFPASDFIELAKFYEEMNKADHAKIVLVRKD
jgi:transglutaminase-like putative cysteine protease